MERMAASSSKRDFLAEYEAEQKNQLTTRKKAHYDTAAIGAKKPRMKRNEEQDSEEFGEYLTTTVGVEQAYFLAAVDVHVAEAGLSYAKEKAYDPRVVLRDLTMIVSTYHLVGYYLRSPVYKAALSDDTSFEVYLFYYGGAGDVVSLKEFRDTYDSDQYGDINVYSSDMCPCVMCMEYSNE